ncbi:MAG: hypothetical protein M3Y93_14910 [Pseudomonadota bacterium]|nr:hypothetical protein [Pseudomonadota bacterium]
MKPFAKLAGVTDALDRRFSPWRRADLAWMLGIVVTALAVRLLHIARQPLWLDEVFTYQRVHMDVPSLVVDSLANRHVPGYFLLLRWLVPTGAADAALRLPSALFGAMAAGAVFVVAWRVCGRRAACFAGWLMVLAPLQVQYGQEARSYTLMVLLISIALGGLVQLAQQIDRPTAPQTAQPGWAAYVLGTLGAMLVLGDAAPWWFASNVGLFVLWRRLRQNGAKQAQTTFALHWLLGQTFILACCMPFYIAMAAANTGKVLTHFQWVPAVSWHQLWVVSASGYLMRAATVVGPGLLPTAFGLLGLLVLLLSGAGAWRLRGRLAGQMLLLSFALLPLLLLLISPIQSLLVPRYILWSAAPFFVLAGIGAALLPRWPYRLAITALLVLGSFNLLPVYRKEVKPRWDLAAATLSAHTEVGDTVYTLDPNAPLMIRKLQPKGQSLDQRVLITNDLAVAAARWKQGSRVWAITGRVGLGIKVPVADFEAYLSALGQPSRTIEEGNEITILMFPAPSQDEPALAP